MGALTLGAILRAEHDTLKNAVDEWLGMSDDHAKEDISWVMGVSDLASNLIDMLNGEKKDGNSDC